MLSESLSIPHNAFSNEQTGNREILDDETIESTLKSLLRGGVLSNMRANQNELGTFFDPRMGYVDEYELSEAGNVLDMYRDALIEGDDLAKRGIYEEETVESIIAALEPESDTRRILMAYWMIEEDTPWRRATGQINSRQSYKSEDFPSAHDVKNVSSRIQKQ